MVRCMVPTLVQGQMMMYTKKNLRKVCVIARAHIGRPTASNTNENRRTKNHDRGIMNDASGTCYI